MVSAAVAQCFCLIAIKARDNDQLVAKRLQGRKNWRKFELGAHTLWQPLIVDNAVRVVDDAKAPDCFRWCVLAGRQRRYHGVQQWQSDRRSDTAKHGPA